MNANNIWTAAWVANVHITTDQQKRIENGKAASCTPSVLDKNNCCATFHGRHGNYNTQLNSCTCTDFTRRSLPCKHMYRLAFELGLLSGTVSAFSKGGYTWKQAVDIIEKYPETVQEEFLWHFHSTKDKAVPYKRKKNPEMDVLINDGILNEYSDKETSKFKTVILIDDFLKDKRNLSWYFSRKFRKPTVFNGCEMEYEPLPNDEITAYLRQRGFCLDIPISNSKENI